MCLAEVSWLWSGPTCLMLGSPSSCTYSEEGLLLPTQLYECGLLTSYRMKKNAVGLATIAILDHGPSQTHLCTNIYVIDGNGQKISGFRDFLSGKGDAIQNRSIRLIICLWASSEIKSWPDDLHTNFGVQSQRHELPRSINWWTQRHSNRLYGLWCSWLWTWQASTSIWQAA